MARPVSPLTAPSGHARLPTSRLGEYASVRLFVERAAAVLPEFALTDQNAEIVADRPTFATDEA